jgi:signal transduction histidine kinase
MHIFFRPAGLPKTIIGYIIVLIQGVELRMEPSSNPVSLECPYCGASVPPGNSYCPECNIDLILYTDLLIRQRLEEARTAPPAMPESIEELVPRLGESLVAQKVITADQLQQALQAQARGAQEGKPTRRIGQILIEMEFLRPEELDRAVASMVLQLQKALQLANRRLEERVRERTAELSRALEKLSELNQLKADFIANISHELRTPMTHIVGYIDLLADDTFGPLSKEQRDAMETLRNASQRLNNLIDDLIQYSDSSRGGISLNIQTITIRDCVQDMLSRLTAKSQKGNVRIEVHLPPDLPPVRADSRKITWVIFQLVDNGIKFTPSGGKVSIRAGRSSDRVWVTIEDTGIGIPAGRMGELFTPFHQLDGSSTRRHGGTGMGLHLSRQIVDAHGSKLTVQSKEGSGTRLLFDLPIARSGSGKLK